jgi:hypothetical protein
LLIQNIWGASAVSAASHNGLKTQAVDLYKDANRPWVKLEFPKVKITTQFAPSNWVPGACGALSYSTSKTEYANSFKSTGRGTAVFLLQCEGKFVDMSSEIQFLPSEVVAATPNEQMFIGQIKATKLQLKGGACIELPMAGEAPVVANGTNLVVSKCSNSLQMWGFRKSDDGTYKLGGIELFVATSGSFRQWKATGQCLDVETVTQNSEAVIPGGPIQIWSCTGPGLVKQDQNSQNISVRRLVPQQKWSSEFLRPTQKSFGNLAKPLSKSAEFRDVVLTLVRTNDEYVRRVSLRMLEKYASKHDLKQCRSNADCALNRLKAAVNLDEGLRKSVATNLAETTEWVKNATAMASHVALMLVSTALREIFPIPDGVSVFQPYSWSSAKSWVVSSVESAVVNTVQSKTYDKFLKGLYVKAGAGGLQASFCSTAFAGNSNLFIECKNL